MKTAINKIMKKFHIVWFTTFLVGIIATGIYEIVLSQRTLIDAVNNLKFYCISFYLPITISILILHVTLSNSKRLQIFCYYYIWIDIIYRKIKFVAYESNNKFIRKLFTKIINKFFEEYYCNLIIESFPNKNEIKKEDKDHSSIIQSLLITKQPLFVKRSHLLEKNFWNNWAYAIVLLFKSFEKIHCYRIKEGGKPKYCLEIDLNDQFYGIYNSGGKKYIEQKFCTTQYRSLCKDISLSMHEFLTSEHLNGFEFKDNMVFRWASGGVLPIAKWMGQKWFVLLFRDIEPIGWNIPNGASETDKEYTEIDHLIIREFTEEIILLDKEPLPNDGIPAIHKRFRLPIGMTMPSATYNSFIKKQMALRYDHDNLKIEIGDGPILKPFETPFSLKLSYYDDSSKKSIHDKTDDIIFNINPNEFGIEILRVLAFEMDDNDYILDGEVWELGSILVRQPIMLLSCDYVQKEYEKSGEIGIHINEKPYADCKKLETILADSYKIFDKDIELRKRRIEKLTHDSTFNNSNEIKRCKSWLDNFEKLFYDLKNGKKDITREDHNPLTNLCPVTWKSLGIFCHHKIGENKT